MSSRLSNFAIVGAIAASALVGAAPASADVTHGDLLVAAAERARKSAGHECMGDEADAISELAVRWLSSRDDERIWDRPAHAGTVSRALRNERRTSYRREQRQIRNRDALPFPTVAEPAQDARVALGDIAERSSHADAELLARAAKGETATELADRMGSSPVAIRQRLSRLRRSLREG